MVKDTRSFFERLAGGAGSHNEAGEEEVAEDEDFELDADSGEEYEEEETAVTASQARSQPKNRPVRAGLPDSYVDEPEKGGVIAAAANTIAMPVKSFFTPRAKIKHAEKAKHEKVIAAPVHSTGAQEQENEVEGQLTVDIYDDDDKIVIQSTVAGVRPEDMDVGITNDMITIKGRRRRNEEISEDKYYYRELYWGSFSRSIILPEEVETDKVDASLKNGLLIIKLPKKNKNVTQKVRVKME